MTTPGTSERSTPTSGYGAAGHVMSRLMALRRRLRFWLALDGLSRVTVRMIAFFLTLAAVDCWLDLPAFLRAAAALMLLLYLIASLDRRVLRALLQSIPLGEIAARLDRVRADDSDRLTSVVDHVEHRADGAAILWQRVERDVAERVHRSSFDAAVASRPTLRRASIAAAFVAIPFALTAIAPGWLETAWLRTIWPFGGTTWPSRVGIEPISQSKRVARGEPFTAEMRVTRGGGPRLRAFLVTQERGRERQRHMMRLDPDGVYRRTLDSVSTSLTCWFEAGDADTVAAPFHLRAVDRPALASVTAIITPPACARDPQPYTDAIDDRQLNVRHGGRVDLRVVSTKPVRRAPSGAVDAIVRFDDGTEVPLAATDASAKALTGNFAADQSRRFQIALVDHDGLASRADLPFSLTVQPDEPPTLAILEPPAAIDATPEAIVRIRAAAEDDVGLKTWVITPTIADRPALMEIDLLAAARRDPGQPTRLLAEHDLRLATLGVRAGDVVEYRSEATDECAHEGAPREPARTPIMRIRVVGATEAGDRLRADFLALQSQVRSLLAVQEALRDQGAAALTTLVGEAAAADEPPAEARPTTRDESPAEEPPESAALRSVAAQQRGLAERTLRTAGQCDEWLRRLTSNALRLDDLSARATSLENGLRSASSGPMTTAARGLDAAAVTDDRSERRGFLSPAVDAQAEAVARLRGLLALVGDVSDVAGAVRRARELLDRQESLTTRTVEVSRATSGDTLRDLTAATRATLTQLRHEQDRLADETRQFVARLAVLGQQLDDRTAAAALQRAFGAAEGSGVADKMAEAARHVGENRTGRALERQRQSESALREILAALERAPLRQLEELSKQLTDVARRLDRIIAAQERLISENRAAGAGNRPQDRPGDESAERTRRQADRQSSLSSTTRALVRQLESSAGPMPASDADPRTPLQSAAGRMDSASRALGDGDEDDALASQRPALVDLRDARQRLLETQEKADDELARRSLDAIRGSLVRIRDEQAALTTRTKEGPKAGEGSRTVKLRLRGLARQQSGLADALVNVRKTMTGAIVFAYVCDGIVERMRSAADALDSGRPDPAVEIQSGVVVDLTRLIELLARPPERPDHARFAEAAGGGGDAGTPTRERPIPPLAELKMLRLLQADLNDATAAISHRARRADAKAIDALGARQAELRGLAETMMKRAEAER